MAVLNSLYVWVNESGIGANEYAGRKQVVAQVENYERVCAERDDLAKALREVDKLDPSDTDDGFNEWGEAECFNRAKKIARAALAKVQP